MNNICNVPIIFQVLAKTPFIPKPSDKHLSEISNFTLHTDRYNKLLYNVNYLKLDDLDSIREYSHCIMYILQFYEEKIKDEVFTSSSQSVTREYRTQKKYLCFYCSTYPLFFHKQYPFPFTLVCEHLSAY